MAWSNEFCRNTGTANHNIFSIKAMAEHPSKYANKMANMPLAYFGYDAPKPKEIKKDEEHG